MWLYITTPSVNVGNIRVWFYYVAFCFRQQEEEQLDKLVWMEFYDQTVQVEFTL